MVIGRSLERYLMGRGGGVYIHIFEFYRTNFFSNENKFDQFEKESFGQSVNI